MQKYHDDVEKEFTGQKVLTDECVRKRKGYTEVKWGPASMLSACVRVCGHLNAITRPCSAMAMSRVLYDGVG